MNEQNNQLRQQNLQYAQENANLNIRIRELESNDAWKCQKELEECYKNREIESIKARERFKSLAEQKDEGFDTQQKMLLNSEQTIQMVKRQLINLKKRVTNQNAKQTLNEIEAILTMVDNFRGGKKKKRTKRRRRRRRRKSRKKRKK